MIHCYKSKSSLDNLTSSKTRWDGPCPPNNRSGFRSLNLMTIGKNSNYHHSFMLAKGGRKILNIFDIFALLCLQFLGYVWSFLFKLKMYTGSPWFSGWLGPDNQGITTIGIAKCEFTVIEVPIIEDPQYQIISSELYIPTYLPAWLLLLQIESSSV